LAKIAKFIRCFLWLGIASPTARNDSKEFFGQSGTDCGAILTLGVWAGAKIIIIKLNKTT
jgi:hypothetical protein